MSYQANDTPNGKTKNKETTDEHLSQKTDDGPCYHCRLAGLVRERAPARDPATHRVRAWQWRHRCAVAHHAVALRVERLAACAAACDRHAVSAGARQR